MSNNPQALVNPEALTSLKASLADGGEQGTEVLSMLLTTLRETLASAISDVFILATATLVVGFVATLFLKEVPLRTRAGRPSRGSSEE